MIKLIVLDLDFTLTSYQNQISALNRQTVITVQKKGVQVMISTGRGFTKNVQKLVTSLQIDKYRKDIFVHNGALLYNSANYQILRLQRMKQNSLQALIAQLEVTKTFAIFWGTTFNQAWYCRTSWLKPIVGWLGSIQLQKINATMLGKQAISSVYIFPGLPWWNRYKPAILKQFGIEHKLIYYNYKNCFIKFSVTNKGAALVDYLQKHQIRKDEVMAIGDSNNDLELMHQVKYSIAVANARPNVRAIAYDHTAHYKADGVARAIRKYVLKN